jgi:hypothetical protein
MAYHEARVSQILKIGHAQHKSVREMLQFGDVSEFGYRILIRKPVCFRIRLPQEMTGNGINERFFNSPTSQQMAFEPINVALTCDLVVHKTMGDILLSRSCNIYYIGGERKL